MTDEESFEERRDRTRVDVHRTLRSYTRMVGAYTDAIKDHTRATVDYVTDLFDQDQSAGEIVKNGLGLLIGCCTRQKKMWHDLCGAVHDDDERK
jgi:hypothetical protein